MDGKDLNPKSHQKKAAVAILSQLWPVSEQQVPRKKRRIPQEDMTSTACGLNHRAPATRMRQKPMHRTGKQKTHFLS